ncbi:MAG TPA: alanine--tRNA ligase, partial [Burkholderiales bacterium]|nr:alanine--tRNA ligase [Burkholderiales bacterium]
MKSNEIRATFLDYFKSKGHSVVASSPLVPANDPTLLFVNSGMVQFKDVFLGQDKRAYVRATSSQRSLRAGGKHNDLENVGYTARHHTFFEMLGNFSFGDYFKKDAIQFAWELLTQVYKLAPEKLWATVYHTDDEAYELWTGTIGLPAQRVVRIGDKGQKYQSDNFWQMADTGPCGPCSEIFYDHGPGVAGGPPGSPDEDGDRYIEIWNLVFMQFNRDDKGELHPLPRPSVDTGMGLERIAAVLQGKHSNYEIDLFQDLIRAAARETGQALPKNKALKNPSLNVIADHIRACAFLIVDGVIPGNEGRGYVLRRIVRRAIRHGYQLGRKEPFFFRLVEDLDRAMGDAYPELRAHKARVAETLKAEEEKFAETLETGMKLFDLGARTEARAVSYIREHFVREFAAFEEMKGSKYFDAVFHRPAEEVLVEVKKAGTVGGVDEYVRKALAAVDEHAAKSGKPSRMYLVFHGESERAPEELLDKVSRGAGYDKVKVLYLKEASIPFDGRTAFTLYDTYGFPFDLTQDLCREKGIPVDVSAYDSAMQEQRSKARAAS